MRCETAKRSISDALDGALSERRAARLAHHVEACAACRDYRREAALIQVRAGGLAEPGLTDGDWADYGRRLGARLSAASRPAPEASRRVAPAPFRSKWVWAAAASAALILLAVYMVLLRPGAGREPASAPFEDSVAQVLGEAGASPELESSFNTAIVASIEDAVRPGAGEAQVSFGDNPLFWESLTDGELGEIESALQKESKLGGVS